MKLVNMLFNNIIIEINILIIINNINFNIITIYLL